MSLPAIPELSDEEHALVVRLTKQLNDHRRGNGLRTSLYGAKHRVRNLGVVDLRRYSRTASVIGWPAKAVDALAARTRLQGVVPIGGTAGLRVDEMMRENRIVLEVSSAITSAFLHGVSFLVSVRGEDGEPDGLLLAVDAESGTGDWDPRSRRMSSFLHVSRRSKSGYPDAFTLYLPSEIVTVTRDGVEWSVTRADGDDIVPVEPLVYRYRTGKPMGSSRITPVVVGLTEAAMRVCARLEGQSDVYSIPHMLLLGATAEALRSEQGGAAWRLGIGKVLGLPDDDDPNNENPRASVQMIQAASPDPHLAQLKQYAQLFSGESSIPVTSLGVSDMANPTSAESYVASREDLIAEAETAMDTMSPAIERAVARTLAYYQGVDVPDDAWGLRAKWYSPAHTSRAAAADAGAKIIGSVPWLADTDVALDLVGMDPDLVERAIAERGAARARSLLDTVLTTRMQEGTNDGADDTDTADAAAPDDAGPVSADPSA